MKLVIIEPLGVEEEKLMEVAHKALPDSVEIVSYQTKVTDTESLIERGKDADIIMVANLPLNADVIKGCKNLKMLAVAFTGIDHIGVQACRDKNIMICNAAGYSNQTVAELVIGMAIAGLRNVAKANDVVRKGGTSAGIGGREICGRTVGIIGLGKIGMVAAKLFLAFGAKVIAYNRSQTEEAKALGIEYKSLDEVLSESDIVSLNMPLNDSTRGFISADKIALMKPDTVFINCARGPIVDNAALAKALNEDKLGFACLDVFDMEPPIPEDYPILSAKNTLLTPHQAFISEESMIRRAKIVFDNVYAYLDGSPVNVCK